MVSDKLVHGLFGFYRDRFPVDVSVFVELGVFRGDSVNEFARWFPGATVFGVDVVRPSEPLLGNVSFVLADQSSVVLLSLLPSVFDVVVDDASHVPLLSRDSFFLLWPRVRSGGCYVLEDIHPSVLPGMWALAGELVRAPGVSRAEFFVKDDVPVAAAVILWKE